MALSEKVLLKKAEKLQLKELQKSKYSTACISELEELLHYIGVIHQPKPSDYYNRRELVRAFNAMANEIYGNCNFPVVEEFGSFVMDIFSAESDLDLSVNFSHKAVEFPREKKIQILQKFAKKLYTHQKPYSQKSDSHTSSHALISTVVWRCCRLQSCRYNR